VAEAIRPRRAVQADNGIRQVPGLLEEAELDPEKVERNASEHIGHIVRLWCESQPPHFAAQTTDANSEIVGLAPGGVDPRNS